MFNAYYVIGLPGHYYSMFVQKKEIVNQVVWLNSCVRIAGRPVLYKDWMEAGCA